MLSFAFAPPPPTWSITTICSALTMVLSLWATIRLVRSLLARSIALWICLQRDVVQCTWGTGKYQIISTNCMRSWDKLNNRFRLVLMLVVMLVVTMQADYMNTSLLCCLEMMWPHRRSSDWASYKEWKFCWNTKIKIKASYKDKSLLKCEDQNKSKPDERPGDGDPLPFSSGQLHPSLPDHCLVLRGKKQN